MKRETSCVVLVCGLGLWACSGNTDGDSSMPQYYGGAPPGGSSATGGVSSHSHSPGPSSSSGSSHALASSSSEADCPDGFSLCSDRCVNRRVDPQHCGTCFHACSTNQVCQQGQCVSQGDCQQTSCMGLSYCDLSTGQCKPGCNRDDQCSTHEQCDAATHACVCKPGYHRNNGECSCGTKPEEGTCPNGTRDCDCGLECVAGLCLKTCATPETQDNCLSTQLCTTLAEDINACLTTVAKDKSCVPPKRCGAGLVCQFDLLADGGPAPMTMACHTPCNYGSTNPGCTAPERCLPSAPRLVEHEINNGHTVACVLDAGSACHAELGYSCTQTGDPQMTAACARPIAACGTAVENLQLWEADGGAHPLSRNELCNHGPDESIPVTGGSIPVRGSRFCDPHHELESPPMMTVCMPALANGYNTGVCIALCSMPSDGQAPAQETQCEANGFCEKDAYCDRPLFAPQDSSGQFISCGSGTVCPEGSSCCNLGSHGHLCITRTGMCSHGPRRGH